MSREPSQSVADVISRLREMKVDQGALDYDEETQHAEAERIVCGFLRDLGYPEVADLFLSLRSGWWYA